MNGAFTSDLNGKKVEYVVSSSLPRSSGIVLTSFLDEGKLMLVVRADKTGGITICHSYNCYIF